MSKLIILLLIFCPLVTGQDYNYKLSRTLPENELFHCSTASIRQYQYDLICHKQWTKEYIYSSLLASRPLWKNIWFTLTIVIILTGIFVLIIISWLKKYKQEKIELEKKAEESIFDERNQLRTLIDNMPDVIYIKDQHSRFILGNKMVAEVMGTVPKNLIGKTDFDFYTYELASRFYSDEQAIIKSGKAKINYEEPCLDKNGNRIIISTTKVPLKNKDGKVVGIVGIGRDITRLKNVEKELRRKSEDLQGINQLLEERQEEIQMQSEKLALQTENLQEVNKELEKLNKTKDKFFSIIAHDLKNPFHAIIGFSDMLRKDFNKMDDNQKINLLELINISSASAYSLLENLLQWARTQTDKIKFTPENINISEIVKSTIDLQKISAEKKNIKLKSHISERNIVYADKNMITTVIRNLVSNAIKFSKPQGTIEISSVAGDKYIDVTVSDNGTGISKENLDKLFRIDSYYSTSGTLGETGTGLGLIICKEFVEKNGGIIKVESEEGKGSSFTFSLPASKPVY
jgi:PAS domain S-box-containing protein